MHSEYLLQFLQQKNIQTIQKKQHSYLTYYGLEQQFTYILKKGVVKISVVQADGREFNIAYIKAPDIISLLKDEVSAYTSSPFNVRIETQTAEFFVVPRVMFWDFVNQDIKLQEHIKYYYRRVLTQTMRNMQHMLMNGKTGAVASFLYDLINFHAEKVSENTYALSFPVTNEDIASFCGISTRNSVNRILHQFKAEGIRFVGSTQLVVEDESVLTQFVQE